jgi:hypothetical protein
MWKGATHGRVTKQAIVRATGRGENLETGGTEDAVVYFYWRDLYRPVVRQLAMTSVRWHFDRIRYTGLPIDEHTDCRSIGHWNRPDQLEYFSVVAGQASMHLQLAGSKELTFQLAEAEEVLAIPPGCWHHTTTLRAATVDNIYCYLTPAPDSDKYSRQGQPSSFTSDFDAHTWKGCTLTDLFSGDAEHIWKRLDEECARLANHIADDRP